MKGPKIREDFSVAKSAKPLSRSVMALGLILVITDEKIAFLLLYKAQTQVQIFIKHSTESQCNLTTYPPYALARNLTSKSATSGRFIPTIAPSTMLTRALTSSGFKYLAAFLSNHMESDRSTF